MARMTLTQKLDSAILAIRDLNTKLVDLGAENAKLRAELAAIKNPPPATTLPNASIEAPKHVERETESEEPVSGFKALWNRAKKLTAVTGISHFVRGDKVYRGYGRDVVAIV